ncbi:MAG: zf-HC2 domain-containing protein [Bacteroidota bacterium]
MNCQTSKKQISQLLDNELSNELLQPLFHHLSGCEGCRSFFVQAQTIHDSARKIVYIQAPEVLDQKFAVLGMESQPKVKRITLSTSSAILSGFVICLMSLVLFAFLSNIYADVQQAEYQHMINSLMYERFQ